MRRVWLALGGRLISLPTSSEPASREDLALEAAVLSLAGSQSGEFVAVGMIDPADKPLVIEEPILPFNENPARTTSQQRLIFIPEWKV